MSPCKGQAINLRVPNCLCATELPNSETSSTEVPFPPETFHGAAGWDGLQRKSRSRRSPGSRRGPGLPGQRRPCSRSNSSPAPGAVPGSRSNSSPAPGAILAPLPEESRLQGGATGGRETAAQPSTGAAPPGTSSRARCFVPAEFRPA